MTEPFKITPMPRMDNPCPDPGDPLWFKWMYLYNPAFHAGVDHLRERLRHAIKAECARIEPIEWQADQTSWAVGALNDVLDLLDRLGEIE